MNKKHDPSCKQGYGLGYSVRDLAEWRAVRASGDHLPRPDSAGDDAGGEPGAGAIVVGIKFPARFAGIFKGMDGAVAAGEEPGEMGAGGGADGYLMGVAGSPKTKLIRFAPGF